MKKAFIIAKDGEKSIIMFGNTNYPYYVHETKLKDISNNHQIIDLTKEVQQLIESKL